MYFYFDLGPKTGQQGKINPSEEDTHLTLMIQNPGNQHGLDTQTSPG